MNAGYDVRIRKNATGEIHTTHMDLPWGEASLYWWTEGNMACDCARADLFARACGQQDEPHTSCGDELYAAIDATMPDGTVILIDESEDPS